MPEPFHFEAVMAKLVFVEVAVMEAFRLEAVMPKPVFAAVEIVAGHSVFIEIAGDSDRRNVSVRVVVIVRGEVPRRTVGAVAVVGAGQ
jgi:hypothetical protein